MPACQKEGEKAHGDSLVSLQSTFLRIPSLRNPFQELSEDSFQESLTVLPKAVKSGLAER